MGKPNFFTAADATRIVAAACDDFGPKPDPMRLMEIMAFAVVWLAENVLGAGHQFWDGFPGLVDALATDRLRLRALDYATFKASIIPPSEPDLPDDTDLTEEIAEDVVDEVVDYAVEKLLEALADMGVAFVIGLIVGRLLQKLPTGTLVAKEGIVMTNQDYLDDRQTDRSRWEALGEQMERLDMRVADNEIRLDGIANRLDAILNLLERSQ